MSVNIIVTLHNLANTLQTYSHLAQSPCSKLIVTLHVWCLIFCVFTYITTFFIPINIHGLKYTDLCVQGDITEDQRNTGARNTLPHGISRPGNIIYRWEILGNIKQLHIFHFFFMQKCYNNNFKPKHPENIKKRSLTPVGPMEVYNPVKPTLRMTWVV